MAIKKSDTPPEQKPETEEEAKGAEHEVVEHEVVIDEQTAVGTLNAGDTTPMPEIQTRATLGVYKANRLHYDLSSIIGGKIVAAVAANEMGGDTDKIGLVVEVESVQRPTIRYIIWPVQDLKNLMAPITDFEINVAE